MPRLAFDPIAHEYRLDGRKVPSVTGLMRISSLTGNYSFNDPIHAFRGHCVHHGCALLDAGADLAEMHVTVTGRYANDPEHLQVARDIETGYWPAFMKWKNRTGFQGRIYECSMIHPTLGFAGTFDVCGEAGDEIWLVDLKSGVLPELVPVQLAGYELLIRQGSPVDEEHPGIDWLRAVVKSGEKIHRKAVRLEKDGTDTLFSQTTKGHPYDSPMFDTAWKSAISLYNLRSAYGLL